MRGSRGEPGGEQPTGWPAASESGGSGARPELEALAIEMRQRVAEIEARLAESVPPSPAPAPAKAKKPKKARRTKTSHEGVKLRSRTWESGDVTWFARWVDPDNPWIVTPDGERKRREQDTNLTKLGLTTEAARVDWCRRKSAALKKRAADLEAGAARHTNTPLREALNAYLAHVKDTKRKATHGAYRLAVERFLAWAERRGLETTDQVLVTDLATFREVMVAGRKHEVVSGKGAGQGAHAPTDKRLSEASINSYLGAVVIALNHLRRVGKLSKIRSGEEIQDALKPIKEPRRSPEILRALAVRQLLLACADHDAACWAMTRDENAGLRAKGTTPRYPAIMPFVVFLLLTGCRVGEALSLEWIDVDLDAAGDHGQAAGVVRVQADKSKTSEERDVDVAPTPALGRLLRAMKDRTDGKGRVFPDLTDTGVKAALRRLVAPVPPPDDEKARPGYGAPAFGWHTLRRTCGTFLTCSPGIYGTAGVFLVARRLGHSVQVSEKHYLNTVRGIDPKHRTLEDALGVTDLVDGLVAQLGGER